MNILRILALCILLPCTSVLACNDLSPNNPDSVNVPAYLSDKDAGATTGTAGVTDFSHRNDDCTLDCRCEFNHKTSAWEGKAPAKKVCIFMNQCTHCKSTDKECTIRVRQMDSRSLLSATFYADNPAKTKIEMCAYTSEKNVRCTPVSSMPAYVENNQ